MSERMFVGLDPDVAERVCAEAEPGKVLLADRVVNDALRVHYALPKRPYYPGSHVPAAGKKGA